MEIIVNQDLCKGCGVCVRACPNGAIDLWNRTISIDKDKCTLCRACISACPTGALQLSKVEKSLVVSEPPLVEVIQPKTRIETMEKKPGIGSMALAFFGQYVLPRMTDLLATYLDRKISSPNQTIRVSSPTQNNFAYPYRRRRRRRGRNA